MDAKAALVPWQAVGLTNMKNSWALDAILTRAMNSVQMWCLQHPNFLTRVILTLLYYVELVLALVVSESRPRGTFLYRSRLKHVGPNFCAFAGVVVCEHSEVAKLILSPQQRGPFIAWSKMVGQKFPENMLLFMSDKEAGGDGSRERLKELFLSLLHSPQVMQRLHSPTAKAIVDEFAGLVVDISKQRVLAGRPKLGNAPEVFVAKYILHVVFGYAPDDGMAKRVANFVLPYLTPRGLPFGPLLSVNPWEKWAVDLIRNSPLLQSIDYQSVGFDIDYVANGLMPILFVAAIPGPASFIHFSLPNLPQNINLSVEDSMTARQTFLEVLRLNPAVGTVTTIAQRPFTVNISGKMEMFPTGTKLCYNIRFAGMDPTVFIDPLKFDPTRGNLVENTVNFASVGERNYGRQCPGRKIAETMGMDLFAELGKRGWTPASVE